LVSSRRRVEAALPRVAAGLSRRTLDEALLGAASAAGARIVRGCVARAAEPQCRRIRLEDGEEVEAKRLILATGKHELRGGGRPLDLADHPVGLRTALRPTERLRSELEEAIELHLFDGGYAGLLLQEDGSANLCLSASRQRLKDAGGIEPLIESVARELPSLAARLSEAEAGEWSAVAGVPYGWRAHSTEEGVYRIGDQAAVIASLAGDGIAVALESGAALGWAIGRGISAAQFQGEWARRSALPVRTAEALRRSAERPRRDVLMKLFGWFPALLPLAARLTRIA
jgi:flavin-dependent dehydrogenase